MLNRSIFERVHEPFCKFVGSGHEAEVSAGQIDEIESQHLRQHLIRLVRHLVLGVAPTDWYELLGMRSERAEVKLNSWILAQLVFHPVRNVRQGTLFCLLSDITLHHLVVSASSYFAGKLVHGF